MKRFLSSKKGKNERPTPLARTRMQNAGRKITLSAHEFQQEKIENNQQRKVLPKVVVCKLGDKEQHPASAPRGFRLRTDKLGQDNGKHAVAGVDQKHKFEKWSNNRRPIESEFEGEARFQGGKMFLQGGLPELGRNRKH